MDIFFSYINYIMLLIVFIEINFLLVLSFESKYSKILVSILILIISYFLTCLILDILNKNITDKLFKRLKYKFQKM